MGSGKKRNQEDKALKKSSSKVGLIKKNDSKQRLLNKNKKNIDNNNDGDMKLSKDEQTEEYVTLCQRKKHLETTEAVLQKHDVIVQRLINTAREDLVWGQYMKCDGLPDPVCVRELNTYLSLWKEDRREDIDVVLARTLEVLPIMSLLENLLENPEEWEIPVQDEVESGSYKGSQNRDRASAILCKVVPFEFYFFDMGQQKNIIPNPANLFLSQTDNVY